MGNCTICPDRVETTLFLMTSVDGKITSGDGEQLDPDRDWGRIHGVKEGIHQYYELEASLATCSLNTGRVMAKSGFNTCSQVPEKDSRLTFFIVDRKPHLTAAGVLYLAQWVGRLYVVTNHPSHPAFTLQTEHAVDNLDIISYPGVVNLPDLFRRIKQVYGIGRMVIESGGTLNATLLRQRLIDHLTVIVAPLLVGGKATSSLVDGDSLRCEKELVNLKALKLSGCVVLDHSYIRLDYDVIQNTVVDTTQGFQSLRP